MLLTRGLGRFNLPVLVAGGGLSGSADRFPRGVFRRDAGSFGVSRRVVVMDSVVDLFNVLKFSKSCRLVTSSYVDFVVNRSCRPGAIELIISKSARPNSMGAGAKVLICEGD